MKRQREEGNGAVSTDLVDDEGQIAQASQPKKAKRSCPHAFLSSANANEQFSDCVTCRYLDTVSRTVLDFDFEKVCSVSLSPINVYACLACGKFFQGRTRGSHAMTHSLEADHRVFINLSNSKCYCLPDDYEIDDSALDDVRVCFLTRFEGPMAFYCIFFARFCPAQATIFSAFISAASQSLFVLSLTSFSHVSICLDLSQRELGFIFRQRLPPFYRLISIQNLTHFTFAQRYLNPRLSSDEVGSLDKTPIPCRTLDNKQYFCGLVGLNNVNRHDHLNAVLQALAHLSDFRNFWLDTDNYYTVRLFLGFPAISQQFSTFSLARRLLVSPSLSWSVDLELLSAKSGILTTLEITSVLRSFFWKSRDVPRKSFALVSTAIRLISSRGC